MHSLSELLKQRVTDAMNASERAVLEGGMKITIEEYRYRQGELDAFRRTLHLIDDAAKHLDDDD